MNQLTTHALLTANRENLYRFLGRLYKIEVDQPLLDQMKSMVFPAEGGPDELVQGYRMLGDYLKSPGLDPLTDLAADYAKVFLGAGITEGDVAFPYESVYTSPERLIMQDARDQVLAHYRSKNLNKAETLLVPEDHIALELEFMAYLCATTQAAIKNQDIDAVVASLDEQKYFLEKHLLNWTTPFCNDVQKCAETNFYKGLSQITSGFLAMDQALLEEMIADVSISTDAVS